MISVEKRFIFIHIYKTAGTSVTKTLEPYIIGRHEVGAHPKVSDYQDLMGRRLSSFFTFTFVRNPFDWLVSLYEYIRQEPDHHLYDLVSPMTFAEFILWQCDHADHHQLDWVTVNGARCVDYIGRFETLAVEFQFVCELIGVSHPLIFANKTKKRKHWLTYYTPALRDAVVAAYAADFEAFGYSKDLVQISPNYLPKLNNAAALAERLVEVWQSEHETLRVVGR